MFLNEPPQSAARDAAYEADRVESGYVDNLTRLWSWRPDVSTGFAELRGRLQASSSLSDVDRAVLVAATASTRGDSYCSLAWGARLARIAGDDTAVDVLTTSLAAVEPRVAALANWAALVVRDPNAATPADVQALRAVGLGDREIFEATAFIAFRLAFSTVNDALGAEPDAQLSASAPDTVRGAVNYGRPAAKTASR